MNININLDNDFERKLNKLKEKYGEEITKINGFSDEQLDYTDFIDNFVDDKTLGIDESANVPNKKDVRNLLEEMNKPHSKLLAFNKIYYETKKKYDKKTADKWLEDEFSGALYCHDAPSTSFYSYCYAYELQALAEKGLYFLPKSNTSPAKHLTTFMAHLREFIVWVSNRTSGACALPSFFVYTYYFWKKDKENGYYLSNPEYYREQAFQQFIFEVNQIHTRITQSAYTNLIIMDRNYITELFGDRTFPDGTLVIDCVDEIIEHQKVFMQTEARIRHEVFHTFPVYTYALLFQNGKFVDEEFARWCNKQNTEWYDSNFYIGDSVTNLASCCLHGDEYVLVKSSAGVQLDTIKKICEAPYKENKRNFTVFHNGSWVSAKPVVLQKKQLYKITTANNKIITITSDHLTPTTNGDKFATELTTEDFVAFNNRTLDAVPEKDEHLTYEQGFAVGLYAGDGSGYIPKNDNWSNRIVYSLNKANEDNKDIDIVQKALNHMGIANKITSYYDKNVFKLEITSDVLYEFIMKWVNGKYANDKEFNINCLLQSKEFRQGIIDGWYASDGGNSNRIYSISTHLIKTGEVIFTSLGLNTVISVDSRPNEDRFLKADGTYYKNNYELHCIRWYSMKNKRSMDGVYKVINNTEYFKINSIEEVNSDYENVYCFEMKSHEPYFTLPNGMITHNCRMLNDLSKQKQFQSSIGGSLIEIGSVKVSTINLMRIALESKGDKSKFIKILTERTKLNMLVLDRIRHIIQRNIEKGLLPNYSNKVINLEKQTTTNGLTAMFETIKHMGMTVEDEFGNITYTDEGLAFASKIMDTVNKLQKESNYGYNISLEIIPAEAANVKLCKKDNIIYNLNNTFIYSNQWTSLMAKSSIWQRVKLASVLDKKAGGGQILHISLEGERLTEEISWDMLNKIANEGVIYFAYNPKLSLCKHNHTFFGNTCPICNGEKVDEASRIVGYIVPTSTYSSERKEEYYSRIWYDLND